MPNDLEILKVKIGLDGSVVENLPASARDTGDAGSIPGSGRSLGEGMAIHSSILA